MQKIYPVTEMVKSNPWMFGIIPEVDRDKILREAHKWMRMKMLKCNMSQAGKTSEHDYMTDAYVQESIMSALHSYMKKISIQKDYPLHEDPVSKAVYNYVDSVNEIQKTTLQSFLKGVKTK